jgi:membrane protease YdiL (CAAX protease family)
MAEQRRASAIHGFQIAFLAFAAVFLAAPLDKYVASTWQWARDLELPLGRPLIFVIASVILVTVAPLRRRCAALLAPEIAPGRRGDLMAGLALVLVSSLGVFGAIALWHWSTGGEPALARVMGEEPTHTSQMEAALSTSGLVVFVFFAGFIGPIVEEIFFRGMLYPAWKDAWGWVASSFATAVVFGLFHGAFWPQLLGSLVFVCVLRRAGTLRAAIYTHAAFNLLAWYPLLGQWMLPSGRSTGELHVWWFHLLCLAITAVALPWYMWMSRDGEAISSR